MFISYTLQHNYSTLRFRWEINQLYIKFALISLTSSELISVLVQKYGGLWFLYIFAIPRVKYSCHSWPFKNLVPLRFYHFYILVWQNHPVYPGSYSCIQAPSVWQQELFLPPQVALQVSSQNLPVYPGSHPCIQAPSVWLQQLFLPPQVALQVSS